MSKCIVYTAADGSLSLVIPAPGCRYVQQIWTEEGEQIFPAPGITADHVTHATHKILKQEDEAVWLDRVRARSVPADAQSCRVVDISDLPPDGEHRHAWADDGTRIYIDESRIVPLWEQPKVAETEMDLRPLYGRLQALEQSRPPLVHTTRTINEKYDDNPVLTLIAHLADRLEALENAPQPEPALAVTPSSMLQAPLDLSNIPASPITEEEWHPEQEPEIPPAATTGERFDWKDVLHNVANEELDDELPELPLPALAAPPDELPPPTPEDHLDLPDMGEPTTDDLISKAVQDLWEAAESMKLRALGGHAGQLRYETALKARNGSTDATENLQGEARDAQMTVVMLANDIIGHRKQAEGVVSKIDATLRRAKNALEIAERMQIRDVVQQGLAEMRAAADGTTN